MTTCTFLKPRVQMAEKAGNGPGIGVHEAVAAASAQLEVLRDDAMVRVKAIMTRLEAQRGADTAAEPGEMRKSADELAGLCGVFGLVEIGSAASSLCRLLDLTAPGLASAAAVAVHLDALQLFARAKAQDRAAVADTVLAGLRQVVFATELRSSTLG